MASVWRAAAAPVRGAREPAGPHPAPDEVLLVPAAGHAWAPVRASPGEQLPDPSCLWSQRSNLAKCNLLGPQHLYEARKVPGHGHRGTSRPLPCHRAPGTVMVSPAGPHRDEDSPGTVTSIALRRSRTGQGPGQQQGHSVPRGLVPARSPSAHRYIWKVPPGPRNGRHSALYLASCLWKYIIWFHNGFCSLVDVWHFQKVSGAPQPPAQHSETTLLLPPRLQHPQEITQHY